LSEKEKKELVEATVEATLKALGKSDAPKFCCGGFSQENIKTIKSWLNDGGFTSKEMQVVKDFASAVLKSKRWGGIIFVAILALLAKDIWHYLKVIGKAVGSTLASGGG
jgi:hypothetical protein